MAKFGDVYRWTGPDEGTDRTAMMIYPPHTDGPLWTGIDLVEWGGDFGGSPGEIEHSFSPKLGSSTRNWEKVECTLDQETAGPVLVRLSHKLAAP